MVKILYISKNVYDQLQIMLYAKYTEDHLIPIYGAVCAYEKEATVVKGYNFKKFNFLKCLDVNLSLCCVYILQFDQIIHNKKIYTFFFYVGYTYNNK